MSIDLQELLPAHKAQKMLGYNLKQFETAIDNGDILPVENRNGARYFDPQDVVNLKKGNKKDHERVFSLTSKALSETQEHVRELIGLIVKPTQQTHEALLRENENLRKRVHELEGSMLEVHEMYGTLMRATIQSDLDAEQERQKMEMKTQAFEILKQQIPIITGSFAGMKLMQSLSVDQIEGLLQFKLVTDEQAMLLRKELQKRGAPQPDMQSAVATADDNEQKGETANGKSNGSGSVGHGEAKAEAPEAQKDERVRASEPRSGRDSELPDGSGQRSKPARSRGRSAGTGKGRTPRKGKKGN